MSHIHTHSHKDINMNTDTKTTYTPRKRNTQACVLTFIYTCVSIKTHTHTHTHMPCNLSEMYCCAIFATRGSAGFASVKSEQIESKTWPSDHTYICKHECVCAKETKCLSLCVCVAGWAGGKSNIRGGGKEKHERLLKTVSMSTRENKTERKRENEGGGAGTAGESVFVCRRGSDIKSKKAHTLN